MKISRAIVVSLVSGWLFYGVVVLGEVLKYRPTLRMARILLWNMVVFNFSGSSEPVYDGAAGFPGSTWVSFLSGFIIYPVVFFALFAIRSRFKK